MVDTHSSEPDTATLRPMLALAMLSLTCLGDACTYSVLTRCGTELRAPQMACYEAVARRACLPLADASLDRRRQNAYKSAHRGEALRTRSAPTTPRACVSGRWASVRGTPRCARRDCHAVV